MRTISKTGAVIIGMLFILPVAALAEDTGVNANAEAVVTTGDSGTPPAPSHGGGKPMPVMFRMEGHASASSSEGAKGPGNIPPGAMMKGGDHMMASGTRPIPKGVEMRDHMMASGTKLIPPGIEDRMEGRDGDHARMMGSGTSERMKGDCMGKASSTDCGDRGGKGIRHGEMLKHAADLLFNRVDAAIKRFTKLTDRIDSRITKLKAQGTDTTAAEADVATARAKIKEAQDALDAAKAVVVSASVTADASSTPGNDAGKPVRDQLEKAKQALMSAAKTLGDAVSLLKGEGGTGEGMHDGTTTPMIPGMMRTKDHMASGTPNGSPDGSL